jgi:phosphatidylserine/phosphatidylglycerophosphate/cardiolipin synthase-like enzyme
VFDRERLFIGCVNFDQRSGRLKTEIGLIIDSPELAQQTAARFDAMAQPENAYAVSLRDDGLALTKTWSGTRWKAATHLSTPNSRPRAVAKIQGQVSRHAAVSRGALRKPCYARKKSRCRQ